MRILLVNGSEQDFFIFEETSKNESHDIWQATFSALKSKDVLHSKPDILAIGTQIKPTEIPALIAQWRLAAEHVYLPILLLTDTLPNTAEYLNSLDIDGVLVAPYSSALLSNKLWSLSRLGKLETTIKRQHEALLFYELHQSREKEVAQSVCDKISHFGCLDDSAIKYSLSTHAAFNGETILAARKPSGDLCIMVNDFTGQGIPATIGTLPVAEIFYTMVAKGFNLSNILTEINKKLHTILPVGVFCRACAAELNMFERVISIWNGGFPECVILSNKNNWNCIENTVNVPLGILSDSDFKLNMQVENIEEGDRFFIFSDDILKLKNEAGQTFGLAPIQALFNTCTDIEQLFQDIHQTAWRFAGEHLTYDPITMLEMRAVSPVKSKTQQNNMEGMLTRCMRDWHFTFELHPQTLREFDPLPLLLQILMESPELQTYKGALYTILAELYSNALDHGVLKLDSSIKSTPQGFVEYYVQREQLLKELADGFVRFNFKHEPSERGGRLIINVEDSGIGFDFSPILKNEFKKDGYSGRGIPLIRSLCESFQYSDPGNRVEVIFIWDMPQ